MKDDATQQASALVTQLDAAQKELRAQKQALEEEKSRLAQEREDLRRELMAAKSEGQRISDQLTVRRISDRSTGSAV